MGKRKGVAPIYLRVADAMAEAIKTMAMNLPIPESIEQRLKDVEFHAGKTLGLLHRLEACEKEASSGEWERRRFAIEAFEARIASVEKRVEGLALELEAASARPKQDIGKTRGPRR